MKLSIQYVAGLFDGEGWFTIARMKGSHYRARREWAYQCRASLVLKDEFIVKALHHQYGGAFREQKKRSDNHADYYIWVATGLNALNFAEQVSSELHIKRPQANVLIDFQKQKNNQGNRPLSDGVYDFYGECFGQMKHLNQKGVARNTSHIGEK